MMQPSPAASPGTESGNLRKRIALLQQVRAECTISGVPWNLDPSRLIEVYRDKLLEQIEWLNDELAINESQLELALFPPATT